MVAIPITEAKAGVSIEIGGNLFQVIDYKHNKTAQQANIKIKMKNMITGAIVENSFRPAEKWKKLISITRTCSSFTIRRMITLSWTSRVSNR